MRKLLVSVALATATLATTVPAAAQYHSGWNQRGPDRFAVNNLLRQLDQAESRIDRSVRRGVISQREAFGLRRDANQIRTRLSFAARGGLSGREFAQLQFQVNRLEQRVTLERRDRDGRRF